MPRTIEHLQTASDDARYVARLNDLARVAISDCLKELEADGMSMRQISRLTRVSIGAVRNLSAGKTADITVGTLIALACGLRSGSADALLGKVPGGKLADIAAREYPSRG